MVKCACHKESKDTKGWNQVGAKWVCPECQADPNRLMAIAGGDDTIIKETEEKKASIIVSCFKTVDGAVHNTEEEANKHLLKKKQRIALHKLINNPVYFSDNCLDIVIDKFDDIQALLKG